MRANGLEAGDAIAPPKMGPAAFQVIVLGSGGGPIEDNVTGFLVRSTATNWAKGSVLAVDAGTHMAAVARIFHEHIPRARPRATGRRQSSISKTDIPTPTDQNSMSSDEPGDIVLTSGPFVDFGLLHKTAKANAAYFVRNLITTYLITHPHLDHLSGFVINTAGFQHTSRPKRLAGLPSTIDAFKTHIFNDTIWPNLSDEDGGVGLVSYMRLAEGGNLAIGEGEGRGYIEVCDGLAVKGWSVSHGKCMHNHGKRGSGSGHNLEQFNDNFTRRTSQSAMTPGTLTRGREHAFTVGPCVIDSSAFFLRDDHTGHEILIFGDVEPDTLSISPRNIQVWADAAPKVAAGLLKGILIECSYDETQSDETLFGHLAPRHVIAELQVLAEKVKSLKSGHTGFSSLKRKRMSNGGMPLEDIASPVRKSRSGSQPRRKSKRSESSPVPTNLPAEGDVNVISLPNPEDRHISNPIPTGPQTPPTSVALPGRPLEGLRIIIIHVKDNLKDEPDAGQTILDQLQLKEENIGLGCTFEISKVGTSIHL